MRRRRPRSIIWRQDRQIFRSKVADGARDTLSDTSLCSTPKSVHGPPQRVPASLRQAASLASGLASMLSAAGSRIAPPPPRGAAFVVHNIPRDKNMKAPSSAALQDLGSALRSNDECGRPSKRRDARLLSYAAEACRTSMVPGRGLCKRPQPGSTRAGAHLRLRELQ